MSKLTDTQPDNLNQLSVVGFDVNFSRLPNTEYFCQRVNIPAVVLGETAQANPDGPAPIIPID